MGNRRKELYYTERRALTEEKLSAKAAVGMISKGVELKDLKYPLFSFMHLYQLSGKNFVEALKAYHQMIDDGVFDESWRPIPELFSLFFPRVLGVGLPDISDKIIHLHDVSILPFYSQQPIKNICYGFVYCLI